MTYITYIPNKHQIGGLGHCFVDYLTAVIISEIYTDVEFVHKPLIVANQTRNMLVDNSTSFNWNEYLNLQLLGINDNLDLQYNQIQSPNKYWENVNIIDFKKNLLPNKINYLVNNNRIRIFDLYNYELNNLVPKNTTKHLIMKLKNNFYLKHKRTNKIKKLFNIYLRRGDFEKFQKSTFNDPFIIDTFDVINKLIKINNYDYTINVISAGTSKQMYAIKNQFKSLDVNFVLNECEKEVFYLMTQSDILLFYDSTFPLTASLFCDGLIIKKRNDGYVIKSVKNKDMKFLDNYIITDKLDDEDVGKISDYL